MIRGTMLDLDSPRERWIEDLHLFASAGRFLGAIRSEPDPPLRDVGLRIVLCTAFGQPIEWRP